MVEPYANQSGQSGTQPPTAPSSRAVAASSGATTILVLAFATLLALVPVLVFPVPPLADYPNHLARMHVIGTIGGDPDLARYYEIHWRIIPNLVMDLVVPQLARIVDIYHAGQIYAVACLALVASGVFVLNRALFGRWSVLSVAALPFLYNHIFFLGYMNYWFGVGLALWATSVWMRLRDRAWPWRLAASTLFAIALFFSHLFAAGIYGMTLLAFELSRLWRRRQAPLAVRLADFAATGLPFLLFVPLLLASPTLGLAGTNQWSLPAKLEGLYFAVSTYSDLVDFALVAAIAAVLAWTAFRRELRVHPAGWILIGLGAAVYLAMPNVFFDTYVADERLPAALVIIALAFFSLDGTRIVVRHVVALLLVVLLAARVAEVGVNWIALSRQTADVRASTRLIAQRGARVLVGTSDQISDNEAFDFALAHAACLAIIERSAFVANAFVFPGKQIMEVRPAYRQIAELADGDLPTLDQLAAASKTTAQPEGTGAYWRQWQRNFDYLYLMYTTRDEANPFPDLLTLVHDGDRFKLYRIRKTGP
jgi:hypothetical protein